MTKEEELLLLRRAQDDDMSAFEEIVRTHEKTVYNLALRSLGCREDAEDAVQEVFLKAYTGLKSFRGESKLSVWLYRITNNVCIDLLRRRKDAVSLTGVTDEDGEITETELPDSRFDPVSIAEQKDLRERLDAAIAQLPREQREAFLLCTAAGQRYEEIAATLDIDLGTVKSRIFRARKKLCALLSEDGNFSGKSASNKREGGDRA